MSVQVLVALGSNVGNRIYYLEKGMEAIGNHCGMVIKKAPIIETKPIGNADQMFLNTAIICETDLTPRSFLAKLLAIEATLQRKRTVVQGNRTIDLDIIMWRQRCGHFLVVDTPNLKIPHPQALFRDFVLFPGCIIASDWRHPITQRTLLEELEEFCRTRNGDNSMATFRFDSCSFIRSYLKTSKYAMKSSS